MKHPNRSQILTAITAGWPYRKIMDAYDCGDTMITYWKRKFGKKIKKQDRSPETDRKIKALLNQGKTTLEIVSELKVTTNRVCKIRRGLSQVVKEEFNGWF